MNKPNDALRELDSAYRRALRVNERKTWTSGYVYPEQLRRAAWQDLADLRSALGLDVPELDPKST